MEDNMATKERTIPIRAYLETTTHKPGIKKMMMELFPGVSRTEAQWKIADETINKGRC